MDRKHQTPHIVNRYMIIECDNLSMQYRNGREVLRNVTFSVEQGSFQFLSGASGAGKSSLLRLLALSHSASKGDLRLFGEQVTRAGRERFPHLRRRIGTVFQDFRLLNHLTVEENVGLPLKVAGESAKVVRQKVQELLGWIGLEDYHKVRPEVLSGGQKQRAAIARAVITKPQLLLADEPTGNLDHELSLKLMYLFEALNKSGTTILFATHDEFLMSHFNHPILHIREGTLVQ